MNTPPIVGPQEWEATRQQLLVKEKALTRARDALAAERRRMPWQAVDKPYEFDGPNGKSSLLDLFEGRRQLIVSLRRSIAEHDTQERVVNLQCAVVVDEPELPKFVHEEVDPRARRSDHFGEDLLRHLRK
jgi:predicted dithiol-disulfide oxidoreductase (DUF899 family)